jgi:class 3 adenylate cyclase/HAMP domain-containing protein
MRKKDRLYKRFLNILFKRNKLSHARGNIREVYFGLRIRFLGLLMLVMICIISILTFVMYYNSSRLIEDEKNEKARSLTQILTGPAEFYLDKNIETTKEELQTKYQIIERESHNFLTYNDDIIKILLTDELGRVRFSTSAGDYKSRPVPPYIKEGLRQNEEQLISYDGTFETRDKKTKIVKKTRYRAITYPIFLLKGNVVSLMEDYNRLYNEYRGASKKRKNQIYSYLWNKYRDKLDDDFDPATFKEEKEMPAKVARVYDVDFLFLSLFRNSMAFRNRKVPPHEKWLWNDRWLVTEKENKIKAYRDDNSAKAKEIDDLITSRITELSGHVENIKKLGVLAVVFNVDSFKRASSRNIRQVVNIALIMMAVGSIALLIVLNFSVKNLKKLEGWALSVSKGNLDEKIHIESNDEIGRLGDIVNYMIDEIKVKYHLEKYVSRSTRSMIEVKKSAPGALDLGITGRKNFAFLFSDVRGFTSFSEKNDPETVIEVLNCYLELQSNIIKGNKGDIDDYVGDQIMAHFSGEKMADRAIDTAIRIMNEVARLNEERKRENLPVFEFGIGLHAGDVVVGNIGSRFRMRFACVGDAVNLSSRLCSAAGPGEILVSRHLFKQASKKYAAKESPSLEVKGKEKKVQIVKIII